MPEFSTELIERCKLYFASTYGVQITYSGSAHFSFELENSENFADKAISIARQKNMNLNQWLWTLDNIRTYWQTTQERFYIPTLQSV